MLEKFMSHQLMVYFHNATDEQLDEFENITGLTWVWEKHIKDRHDYVIDKEYPYLVSEDGILLRRWRGGVDDNYQVTTIEEFLAECKNKPVNEEDVMGVFA